MYSNIFHPSRKEERLKLYLKTIRHGHFSSWQQLLRLRWWGLLADPTGRSWLHICTLLNGFFLKAINLFTYYLWEDRAICTQQWPSTTLFSTIVSGIQLRSAFIVLYTNMRARESGALLLQHFHYRIPSCWIIASVNLGPYFYGFGYK